jgi:cell division protein FtsL
MSSIISVSLDSSASSPPADPTIPTDAVPNFDTQDEFYDFLAKPTADDDELQFFGSCEKTIFEELDPDIYFPEFSNTKSIISAHTKIWRAGHTDNILSLIIGTKDEGISYLTGLLVTSITVLICFIAWMVLLITLKGFGRNRVGLLSGRRKQLPPRPSGNNPKSAAAAAGIDDIDVDIDIDTDNKEEKALDASKQDLDDDEKEDGDTIKEMAPSIAFSLASGEFLGSSSTMSGAELSGKSGKGTRLSSEEFLVSSTMSGGELAGKSDKGTRLSSEEFLVSSTMSGAELSGKEELESPETGINGKSSTTTTALKSSGRMSISSKLPWSEHRSIKEEIEARRGLYSTYTFPINFRKDEDHDDFMNNNSRSSACRIEKSMFEQMYHEKYHRTMLRHDLLRDHPDTVRKQYDFLVTAKQQITADQFWKRYEYRCGDTAVKRMARLRKQQPVLSSDEWEHLYATKKKEECWMKMVVVFACVIVIAMSLVMAQKGVQSLRGSLYDGKKAINYAEKLLTGAEGVVDDLATGLSSFQSDVLDLLERTNKGICPRLKPQGLCPQLLEVDSCDFTIHIDLEKNITIDKLGVNTTVDIDREHSVDVSNVTDAIKEKIGLDGTIDLRELLFPDAPELYSDLIKTFSRNWTFVDTMYDVADKINYIASVASQTQEQISKIEWVFYIAVAFDVLVGVLAACMIIHILAGKRMPRSLQCIQRRCLFPLFITCVSLAFIFAIAVLIGESKLTAILINGAS